MLRWARCRSDQQSTRVPRPRRIRNACPRDDNLMPISLPVFPRDASPLQSRQAARFPSTSGGGSPSPQYLCWHNHQRLRSVCCRATGKRESLPSSVIGFFFGVYFAKEMVRDLGDAAWCGPDIRSLRGHVERARPGPPSSTGRNARSSRILANMIISEPAPSRRLRYHPNARCEAA